VLNWLIDDETGTTVTDSLTAAQKKINIASHWNHELLLIRMSQGWKPEWTSETMGVK
jgi:hypothetical protein